MVAPKNIVDGYNQILPGIYELVPNEVYHASGGLSRSNLSDISDSVGLYHIRKNNPDKPTDAMIKGSALHDLVLLPDEFKKNYVVSPVHTKTAKAYKKCVEDNPDKSVISIRDSDDIHFMRDALYDNPTIRVILDQNSILREVSLWVKEPITELLLKARPDLISDGIIYDLKTTSTPHAKAFIHSVYKFGYQMQSAYYQDVCRMNGMTISDFQFVVVGSKPPYLTAIYNLNNDLLQEGRERYQGALLAYRNYLDSDDKWDGLTYGREVVTL